MASNNFFTAKKAEYAKCKHCLTSSISALTPVGNNSSITGINAKLAAFTEWTAEHIDSRQTKLIELTKEIGTVATIEVN